MRQKRRTKAIITSLYKRHNNIEFIFMHIRNKSLSYGNVLSSIN